MPDKTQDVTPPAPTPEPPTDKFDLVAWLLKQSKATLWSLFVFGLGIFCGIGIVYKVKDEVQPAPPSDVRRLEIQIEKLTKEKQDLEYQIEKSKKDSGAIPVEPGTIPVDPSGTSSPWGQPKTGHIIPG